MRVWWVPLLLASLTPCAAHAEDEETARVFLRFVADGKELTALESARPYFEAEVLASGKVALAGTTEMDEVYASCAQDMGVSATAARECRLQAARRIFVEQVLEVSGNKRDKTHFEFDLGVWDPEANSKVYAKILEVEAASFSEAARVGLPQLAKLYVCWRAGDTQCKDPPPDDGHHDPIVPPDDGSPRGRLRASEVSAVVKQHMAAVKKCDPDKRGKMDVTIVIEGDGSVKEASVGDDFTGTKVGKCVLGVVKTMQFRASGEPLKISFDFAID